MIFIIPGGIKDSHTMALVKLPVWSPSSQEFPPLGGRKQRRSSSDKINEEKKMKENKINSGDSTPVSVWAKKSVGTLFKKEGQTKNGELEGKIRIESTKITLNLDVITPNIYKLGGKFFKHSIYHFENKMENFRRK